MTNLRITTNANTITKILASYLNKKLDYSKPVGQGYNRAAVFAGTNTGVQKRIPTHTGHTLYMYAHCACHRLQLASIPTDSSSEAAKR